MRRLYDKFSRKWRDDARFSGKYGKFGTRKPTFNQWIAIHNSKVDQAKETTPDDVRSFLGQDPWLEERPTREDDGHERGVVTIPMVGSDDE